MQGLRDMAERSRGGSVRKCTVAGLQGEDEGVCWGGGSRLPSEWP